MQKHVAVKKLESSWHRILTPQSPTPVTYLLQQGHNYSKNAILPYYSQIASLTMEKVFRQNEYMGGILSQITTARKWKQPKYPLINKNVYVCINVYVYIYIYMM